MANIILYMEYMEYMDQTFGTKASISLASSGSTGGLRTEVNSTNEFNVHRKKDSVWFLLQTSSRFYAGASKIMGGTHILVSQRQGRTRPRKSSEGHIGEGWSPARLCTAAFRRGRSRVVGGPQNAVKPSARCCLVPLPLENFF